LSKHLVFISSIAAQSGCFSDRELTGDDPTEPTNAYGRSKLATEQAIRNANGSFTILRPVVIYGEGEKGNVATIRKIAQLLIPLPFGGLTARHSVLSVQNLRSAIATALTDLRARRETFIVCDPAPVTVPELFARYRAGFGRPGSSWRRKCCSSLHSGRPDRPRSSNGSAARWSVGPTSCLRLAGTRSNLSISSLPEMTGRSLYRTSELGRAFPQ
jgi:nucleoside-diphosphate-sugar epimerase